MPSLADLNPYERPVFYFAEDSEKFFCLRGDMVYSAEPTPDHGHWIVMREFATRKIQIPQERKVVVVGAALPLTDNDSWSFNPKSGLQIL